MSESGKTDRPIAKPTSETPVISVITVVRNGEKHVEETIQSIIQQTYPHVEYIIIDGNSTDSTVSIIKKYADRIHYWISEKDKGIYDAMNKGIKVSTGEWLIFINADDYLAGPNVIADAVPFLVNTKSKVVYGNVLLIYESGPEKLRGSEWKDISFHFRNIRMNISHQGIFHSRALFKDRLYDPTFKITADYDLLLSYLKNHDPLYLPQTVAKMRATGVSASSSDFKLLNEIRQAQINNGIYRSVPSIAWFKSAITLILNDRIIKLIGIERKDKLKRIKARLFKSTQSSTQLF
jgi:glycosyltransferase involved in cell wall biosynthesis